MAICGSPMQLSIRRAQVQLADVLPSVLDLLPEVFGDDPQMRNLDNEPLIFSLSL